MNWWILFVLVSLATSCHYSCSSSCTTSKYYQCLTCDTNRGNNGRPIYGMCYCSENADEDQDGICQNDGSFNQRVKILIVVFIASTIGLGLWAIIVKGMKYFLYKTVQDVQELSLIVFINMYFPQQLDQFLVKLYAFNISSYTFQNLAQGSLYQVLPDQSVASTDGQNIFGKYRLLFKTANFFGNQFTWLIVFVGTLFVAIIIKIVRNCLKTRQEVKLIRTAIDGLPLKDKNQSQASLGQGEQIWQVRRQVQEKPCWWRWLNKLHNMLWLHLLIVFFYFSLIQMNINIFTQIANLTFSSAYATAGALISAFFLAGEVVILFLLLLKAKEELIKPEWMRDYSFSAITYLIRTNFKTLTKYFWFISCVKKILLALMITVLYDQPLYAIVGVCCVHSTYLAIAIYCQPLQRRYLRVHFYLTESMKLFMFLLLITFTTKYTSTTQLIPLTQLLYGVLAFIFGIHFVFLVISLLIQWPVYRHYLNKHCCEEDHPQLKEERVGYRSEWKVFIYPHQ